MSVSGQRLQGGVPVAVKHNKLSVFLDIQKKRREEAELTAAIEERRQNLQSLQQQLDELHKDHEKLLELHTSFDMFLKDEDIQQVVERAERERKEAVHKREEVERLKKKKTELMERNRQLKLEVQSHTVYKDIIGQMQKFTQFKDVDALTEYMESLIHCKEQLAEREQQAQEQVDLMRKEIGEVKNQHHLLQMQRNNELTLLKTELNDRRAEALLLERQWNHIQETAAKKTLELGQIKIATFNLYQMICQGLGEEEDVWMNETEKQLEKIMTFIDDYSDVVKKHQISTETLGIEFHFDRNTKCVTTRSKKR